MKKACNNNMAVGFDRELNNLIIISSLVGKNLVARAQQHDDQLVRNEKLLEFDIQCSSLD